MYRVFGYKFLSTKGCQGGHPDRPAERCSGLGAIRVTCQSTTGAVAAGMAHGPFSGLMLLDQLQLNEALADYYSFHAARADLLRRAGYVAESQTAYARALTLCQNQAERRYLSRQIAELVSAS